MVAAVAGQVAFVGEGSTSDRLAAQLVEEGFDLVPRPASGERSLSVRFDGTSIAVEARGARTVRFSIDAQPAAVAELELLHRAVIALREAGVSHVSQAEHRWVIIAQSRALPIDLRARLARAILAAGYGLTASARKASLTVCAAPGMVGADLSDRKCAPRGLNGRSLESAVRAALEANVRVEVATAQESTPNLETRETRTATVVASIGAIAPVAVAVAVTATVAEVSTTSTATLAEDTPAEPAVLETPVVSSVPWRLTLRAAGGGSGRSPAIDPLVAFGLALAREELLARIDVYTAFSDEPRVGAWALMAIAGPAYEVLDRGSFSLIAGASAGVELHRFNFEGETGARTNFIAALPVTAALDLAPLSIELGLIPSLSRSRRHEKDGEVLWSRSAAQVMVTVGASFSAAIFE